MTIGTPQLLVSMGVGVPAGDLWILDDPVRSRLDSGYVLAGDIEPVDLTDTAFSVSITRGRNDRFTEEINPGLMVVRLRNHDRRYDPSYADGPYYGLLDPGREISFALDHHRLFTGRIDDWSLEWSPTGESTAVIIASDPLAQLARAEMDYNEWTRQYPHERIQAVLDLPEVTWTEPTLIDPGHNLLQDDITGDGTNVLGYLQLVARSDLGMLFADRNGGVRFRSRTKIHEASVSYSWTFTDDSSSVFELPFTGIAAVTGGSSLYGRVTVTAMNGGDPQTATNTASLTDYGRRSLSLSVLLDTDAQALEMATALADLYAVPRNRVSALDFLGHSDNSFQVLAASDVELGDSVTVTFTPNGIGDPMSDRYIVEGITHTLGPAEHYVSLSLGDRGRTDTWILDDPLRSKLDAGNVLAY